jgi:predicted ArsR family transcriptional regulator
VGPRGADDLADLTPLSGLGSSVRRRLYVLVSDAGRPISRDEAAASAGVSRSLAAYHLDKLVEGGLLEASFLRQSERSGPGGGRPAKLYRRSPREFVLRAPPRDYQLLGELLVRAAGEDASGTVRATLERVAYEVGRSFGERIKQNGVAGRDELRDALRLRGYEPLEDEHGTVRLRNCPFDKLATERPEVVCNLNLRLLYGLLDGLGLRPARAVLEPGEARCCVVIAAAKARPKPQTDASDS